MQQQIKSWLDTLTEKANPTDRACGIRTIFVEERGRKFTKIVKKETRLENTRRVQDSVKNKPQQLDELMNLCDANGIDYGNFKSTVHQSVHAFIDHTTGDIYKAASWKAPAKIVRYNIVADFDRVIQNCDIYGSYLYIR